MFVTCFSLTSCCRLEPDKISAVSFKKTLVTLISLTLRFNSGRHGRLVAGSTLYVYESRRLQATQRPAATFSDVGGKKLKNAELSGDIARHRRIRANQIHVLQTYIRTSELRALREERPLGDFYHLIAGC